MFTRHRRSSIDKLNCPHAMGTDTFSPEWPKSFRHILLLPSPSLVYNRRKLPILRVSVGASAPQLQTLRLRIRSPAGACPPPAQRTATGYPGRCAEVVEAGGIATLTSKNRWPTQARVWLEWGTTFLAKRYYDFNIRNYPQFVEKLRYIHRNPVKRGLCERPEDWEWSSFRHYAAGCEGRVEIEWEWTARKRERAAGRLCPAVERGGWPALAHVARMGFRKA